MNLRKVYCHAHKTRPLDSNLKVLIENLKGRDWTSDLSDFLKILLKYIINK